MKKMLSLFLVYAMIFSVFPAGYAETEFDQIIVQAEEPTSLQQNGVEKELTQESLGNVADFPKYYNADVKPQPVYGEMGDGVQIADRGTTVYSVTLRPANGGIDSLTYNVTAPVSGKYALSVRSYSWAEASPVITVNGETVVLQNAIPNNGYSTNGENVWSLANKEGQDIFTETTIAEVTLVRGQNTITFKTPAAFFFDSFYLTPTEVEEIEYYIDGVKANGIKTGELLIVVNHGSYVDGKTVVGAIYENQHLKSTALTALDGKTTAFNFGSFVADAEKIYEFKYFVFADMENLIPATKEGAALIVQQAEAFSSYTFSGTDYTSMNAARTAYHAVYNQVIANYVSAKTDNIHGATIDEDNWIDFNGYGTAWAYDLIVRKAGAPLANYTINAEKAGIYTLTMMIGSWNADATPVVYVNGKAATVSPLRKNLTSWGDSGDWYAANAVADIYLDSGANTISIGTADADYYFDSMQLSYKHEAGEVPPTATPTSMPTATPTSTPTAPPTPTPTAEPTATPAMTADIYVSPYGNDANPGSASAPVKTVAKAQSLAREKDKAEYTIYLNSGIYYLDDTLALTEADNNLTITGPSDGSAVISGGKEVSGWTSAGNGIYYANVDTDDVREFYVNEKPAILAKNKASLSGTGGRLRAVSASAAGITVNTADISGIADPAGSELVFDILWDRLILKVTGVTNNGDGTTTLLISDKVWRDYYAYYAVAKNQWVNEPCSESGYSTTRYYYWIQNNFSLLDEPGEFYFDRDAKRLYYYPRSGEVMPNADCYVGYLTTVISDTNSKGIMTIQGAENITIENIAFEGGTFLYPSTYSVLPKSQEGILWTASDNGGSLGTTMPAQISVQYSSGITFDHIMMRNCAANGISLGLGAADCMIQNSTFTQIGGGAVTVGDHRCADKQTTKEIDGVLTGVSAGTLLNSHMAHDNIITNNVIRDVAKVYAMCSGIKLWHSYNISVTHNTVEDTGYSGVSVGWGWHAIRLSNSINAGNYDISYNKIVNVCNVLEDGANIYTLGIVPKGGTISNNYLSRSYDGMNTIPAGSKYGWHGGIYCDEGSRNWTITNNVVEDTYQWLNSRRGAANTNIIARDNWGTAPHPRTDITGDNAFYSGKVTIDYNFDGIKETDNSTTVTNYVQAADNNWSAYPAAQQVVDAAGAR